LDVKVTLSLDFDFYIKISIGFQPIETFEFKFCWIFLMNDCFKMVEMSEGWCLKNYDLD